MQYRILGPFSASKDGTEIVLGSGKQRALLALLLLHANEAVSIDRLVDELWGETRSTSATKVLQNYVSKLRALLGDGVLITRGHAYELRVEPGELDLDVFNVRVADGRRALAAGDPAGAAETLSAALALWRGAPLTDFAYEEFALAEIERLEGLRLAALTERIEADLQLGRHSALIGELEALVARCPLQERLRGQLMLALYRSGRQAEALRVYQATRRTLVDELGIEPSQELQQLERSILAHDPALERQRRAPMPARKSLLAAAAVGAAAVVAVIALVAGTTRTAAPTVVSGDAVAIIDPGSGRVTGQVAAGAAPTALALGAGGLWVANTDDQTVTHIDLGSGKVVRNVAIGGIPLGLAVGPNAVWVVRRRPDGLPELIKIDPRFDTVGAVRQLTGDPGGAAGVAVTRDGVWVVAQAGLLERLDPTGTAVTARVDTRNTPASVAIGAGSVWAADGFGKNVARIDAATKLVTATTPVGNGADAVATGEGAVWVADGLDDAVVRIDPATNSVTMTIPVGRSPTGIAVGLGSVWVANSRDGTVSRIDPLRNKVVSTIAVGGSPRAIAVGDGRVWVSVQNALIAPGKQAGGVAHITAEAPLGSLDPALAYLTQSWALEYATCAKLFNYSDAPASAGTRLEPEVATALPVPTEGGTSYAFTIRPGFRFSPPSNAPVTAETFRFTIERALSPALENGPARSFAADIVGAQAYEAGKSRHISGVSVRGNTLTIRLVRAAPDIVSRLAMPLFCAVPPDTPIVPTGVRTVPSAGPYYVASYTPTQGAVLKRNPNYHGARPHTLDEIDYRTGVGKTQSVHEIQAGTADFAADGVPPDQAASLASRYGGRRYFANPSLSVWYLALNTSRPLFADARLRRAVNYVLDRRAIARAVQAGGLPAQPADQYLPPGLPGFRDIHPYPLTPDLSRARRLARGHGGHAVLDTCSRPYCRAVAQLVQAELAPLGITVEIKVLAFEALLGRVGTRGEPFDMTVFGWTADYPDPSDFLSLFDGRSITATGNDNVAYFDDPGFNRRLAAAAQLSGPRRYLAYQALDAELTRIASPAPALVNQIEQDFYSARIGCQVYQPVYGVDLAALCLKKTG